MSNQNDNGAIARLYPVRLDDPVWHGQWHSVPEQWRHLQYRFDTPAAQRAFLINQRYLTTNGAAELHDFTPQNVPERLSQEIAWWVWLCGEYGLRKIEPSLLRMAGPALTATVQAFEAEHHRQPASLAELHPEAILRHATVQFERRNHRLPSRDTVRNFSSLIGHLHLHVAVRCTDRPWWAHDIWDLRADPRIPQREHEPAHDRVVRLATIEPAWFREGLRFWFRTCLTGELLRWTTVVGRSLDMSRTFGTFLLDREITSPAIAGERTTLRTFFSEYTDYLGTPQAAARPGRPLSKASIDSVRNQVQAFYTFMADNAEEAATATGNPGWLDLTDSHTRLWGAANKPSRASGTRELTWYSTNDLQRMLTYLDVLAGDRGRPVQVTHPDGASSFVTGLGDPQAARAWLLQALTGRRASEILMLDFDPLEAIPGQDRSPDPAGTDVFVAKLRYQQTKVDGVLPTILVEQAVVNVIEQQQDWIRQHHPDLDPKYLFLGIRHQFNGQRPRTYNSYGAILSKLDELHGLADAAGHPLRFSQTHRLRHTRATELINDGVPMHVVQRYLGHASPEMTMRYAATLAATAEAEFLKHKKIGADGTDIGISPSDIYDMTQLSQRTDRILPNGVCLLPPLKTCDKGNACLTCGHFATDRTHLDELDRQRDATSELVETRRRQFRERTGRELTDDNVWIHERKREIASLDAILTRLRADTQARAIGGAGTAARQPELQNRTRGAHEVLLDKAGKDSTSASRDEQ